jgi:hypothetical protein
LWPELERLFCGELDPGQKWQFKLRLLAAPNGKPHLKGVRTDTRFLHCLYSRETQTLDVVVFAPNKPGRFEGNIILTFGGVSKCELRIPVAGIVRQPNSS